MNYGVTTFDTNFKMLIMVQITFQSIYGIYLYTFVWKSTITSRLLIGNLTPLGTLICQTKTKNKRTLLTLRIVCNNTIKRNVN